MPCVSEPSQSCFLPIFTSLEASLVSLTTPKWKQSSPLWTLQTCHLSSPRPWTHHARSQRSSARNALPWVLTSRTPQSYSSSNTQPHPTPSERPPLIPKAYKKHRPGLNCTTLVPTTWLLFYTTQWRSYAFLCQCPFYPITSWTSCREL